jgi:hypothetical protein
MFNYISDVCHVFVSRIDSITWSVHQLFVSLGFAADASPIYVNEDGECVTDLAYQHPLVDFSIATGNGLSFGGEFESAFFGNDEEFKPAGSHKTDLFYRLHYLNAFVLCLISIADVYNLYCSKHVAFEILLSWHNLNSQSKFSMVGAWEASKLENDVKSGACVWFRFTWLLQQSNVLTDHREKAVRLKSLIIPK